MSDGKMVNKLIVSLGFNYYRRREWMIWAAKARKCPSCKMEAYIACRHLVDLGKGLSIKESRIVRNPHDERIDYSRLITGLFYRGYISSEQKVDYLSMLTVKGDD